MLMLNAMGRPGAVACISGDGGESRIFGSVKFYQKRCGVLVVADISGLPEDGFFAFHIHEGGNCCGEGFPNTGGHYDPSHGVHPDHAGDLPPLLACGGNAFLAVQTGRFRLEDVIGR